MFWGNIGLVGGNFNIPGIVDRLYVVLGLDKYLHPFSPLYCRRTELRALAPPEVEVSIYTSKEHVSLPVILASTLLLTSASLIAALLRRRIYLHVHSREPQPLLQHALHAKNI
jgi:hypothetical protein